MVERGIGAFIPTGDGRDGMQNTRKSISRFAADRVPDNRDNKVVSERSSPSQHNQSGDLQWGSHN